MTVRRASALVIVPAPLVAFATIGRYRAGIGKFSKPYSICRNRCWMAEVLTMTALEFLQTYPTSIDTKREDSA